VTIAISLKVNDGVVLAADSASTLMNIDAAGNRSIVNVYDNANKVINLHKRCPIGAITWGTGSIGPASTSTLLKDFRGRWMTETAEDEHVTYGVGETAERLREFMFHEKAAGQLVPGLGFIVAGYDHDGELAEEYQFGSDEAGNVSAVQAIRVGEAVGATWNGQPDAISRLILGFSTDLPAVLVADLGVPQNQVDAAVDVLRSRLQAQLLQAAMPIQDAIDLARFLVELTVKYVRFNTGAPTVGGPVEIAAITKHEGFKWVQRKFYYQEGLNPG
jgi:hypothetical protein